MTETAEVLQIVDRLVAPITAQLESFGAKLDRVVEQMAQITAVREAQDQHGERIEALERDAKSTSLTMATLRGRNQVILWAVGIIGSAIGIVAAAGAIHLMGWR